MHYKNGREAKNGDKIVLIPSFGPAVIGILYDATAGNDYCNGRISPVSPSDPCPNLKECLHLDDVLKALPAEVPDNSKPAEPVTETVQEPVAAEEPAQQPEAPAAAPAPENAQ